MNSRRKRLLSLLLAAVMLLSLCPVTAMAEEGEEPTEAVEEVREETAEEEKPTEEVPPETEDEEEPEEEPAETEEPAEPPLLAVSEVGASNVASGTCGDNVYWTLDDNGVLTVSGTGDMWNYGWITDDDLILSPWYDYDVTSAVFKEGVTSIGNEIFAECRTLTNVTIPNSVTSIGDYAFESCESLTSVTIPNSVTSIGIGAFDCCSLTSVTIPNSVMRIEDYAFCGCVNLTNVTIPNSVTSIGNEIFADCVNLTNVTIPNSVTSIGDDAFRYCISLSSVTIPNSVTSIGDSAFNCCISLKSVTIPNSVTSIGDYAFYECIELTNITIPDSVTSIGNRVFGDCASLTSINIPNSVTSIGDGAFSECSCLTNITIPDSVTSIGDGAFLVCGNLRDIYFTGTPSQWAAVAKDGANIPSTATVHFNAIASPDQLSKVMITVYANKRTQKDLVEDYKLCEGAEIFVNNAKVATTDQSGQAEVLKDCEFTVKKTGYRDRTLNTAQLTDGKVYLERELDAPVINALWCIDSFDSLGNDKPKDILHEEQELSQTDPQKFVLKPEIDWGSASSPLQKVYLYQNGHSLELSENGSEVVLSPTFDLAETIYIWATNEKGDTTKKAVRLCARNGTLEGFSFNLGDGISFDLSDSVKDKWPFLPDSLKKIDLGIYSPIPVEFAQNNGKVYFAIGYQSDKTSKKKNGEYWEKEIKNFADSVKDLQDCFKDAKSAIDGQKRMQQSMKAFKEKWINCLAVPKGSFALESDFTFVGYIEGYLDQNGEFVFSNGGGIMTVEAAHSYTQPFAVGPVPAYFEIKCSASVETEVNLFLKREIKAFVPQFSFEGAIAVSGGAGVGLAKVASFGGGVTGKLSLYADWDPAPIYVRVKASADWYIKVKLLVASFSFGNTFADATLYEWPSPKKAPLKAAGPPMLAAMMDADNYQADASLMNGHETLMLANDDSGIFATDVYDSPRYGTFSDGRRIALWLGYNENYSGADTVNLYYSVFDGSWSEPQVVEDDGTIDAAPALLVHNDIAYVVWQDATSPLGNTQELTDMAPYMGISAAVFDPSTESFTAASLIADGKLNMTPTLCAVGSSVYAVWLQNGENDWFGHNDSNAILSACCSGGIWSGATVNYSGLGPVQSFAADGSKGALDIAYALDTDGDVTTFSDLEIYRNGAAVTANNVLDSGVSFSNGKLYWYCAGQLMEEGTPVFSEGAALNSDRIQIVEKNGVMAALFVQEEEDCCTLYGAYRDGNGWGNPVPLYSAGQIPDFSAQLDENGLLSVLAEVQQVYPDNPVENRFGQANLIWVNPPRSNDIRLDGVDYSIEEYKDNSDMSFTLRYSNCGGLTVDRLLFTVTDENGEVLISEESSAPILSGQAASETLTLHIGKVPRFMDLLFRVTPVGAYEDDTENNATEVLLNWEDISVENVRWGYLNTSEKRILANIVNRGYSKQENIVVTVHAESPNSEPIQTFTIEQLSPLSMKVLSIGDLPESSYVFYVCVQHPENDRNYGNDNGFVVTDPEKNWGSIEYVWSEDRSGCTAIQVCADDESLTREAEATVTSEITKEATEAEEGIRTYTASFVEIWATAQTATEPVPALGHDWGEATYAWNEDHSTCTAMRVCTRDASHTETDEATVTGGIIKEATANSEGTMQYTAVFAVPWASEQTHTANIPMLEKNPPQQLTPISAPTGDEPLSDFSVEVSYGDADRAEAQRQIAGIVNDNPAVRDFAENNLRAAVAGKEDELLAALELDGLTADDLILGVSMVPQSAAVETTTENGIKVTKMSFEVKPTVTAFVEGMTAPVSAVIPNEYLSAPVTVRLPVDKTTAVGTIVKVEHNGEYFGSFAVQEEDGDKFIEFAASEFSVYSYELTEDNIGVIDGVSYSATLTLKENINVNFYVKIPVDAEDVDITQFVVTSAFDGETKTTRLSEQNRVDDADGYHCYKLVVSETFAYQMNDMVTLSVSYAGVPVQRVQNYPYSVRKYFENSITKYGNSAKAADKSFVALCKAGLDYGANAQMHFSGGEYVGGSYPVYAGEAIVNSAVNPENDLSRAVKPNAVTKREGDIEGFSGYSASLVLGSLTSIKLYFKAESIDGVTVTANCGGNPYGVTTPLLGTDGRYSFLVQGIKSYDLAKPFTISITKGDSTVTITYSVFSYAAKCWDMTEDNLGNLCKAIVLYGTCADDYFTNCR